MRLNKVYRYKVRIIIGANFLSVSKVLGAKEHLVSFIIRPASSGTDYTDAHIIMKGCEHLAVVRFRVLPPGEELYSF